MTAPYDLVVAVAGRNRLGDGELSDAGFQSASALTDIESGLARCMRISGVPR